MAAPLYTLHIVYSIQVHTATGLSTAKAYNCSNIHNALPTAPISHGILPHNSAVLAGYSPGPATQASFAYLPTPGSLHRGLQPRVSTEQPVYLTDILLTTSCYFRTLITGPGLAGWVHIYLSVSGYHHQLRPQNITPL